MIAKTARYMASGKFMARFPQGEDAPSQDSSGELVLQYGKGDGVVVIPADRLREQVL